MLSTYAPTLLAIVVDGLVFASWLFIVALGLTLIFGVMQILNVAHGSFYAFGAYVAANGIGVYYQAGLAPLGGFVVIAASAIAVGVLLGLVLERGLLRFMYGRDEVLMALVTFATGMLMGMKEFGPLGFFTNQVPTMDLPLPIAIVVKPMLLAIELLGLCIKHAVLAIRLLANMVAGHLVLLGLMGLAFGAHASTQFQGDNAGWWGITAFIAVVGSTLFSLLELFVAFLQAYIFTFLSALFIGASTHEH